MKWLCWSVHVIQRGCDCFCNTMWAIWSSKKKNNRGGWSHRHCTTHGTGTSMYPHCRQTFGSSYVFHGVIIHGLKGDNRCLLAPLHSKPSVKLQELAECALSHITKNTRHSLNKKKIKWWSAPSELLVGCRSHCTHICGSFTDIFNTLHAASSVLLQSRTKDSCLKGCGAPTTLLIPQPTVSVTLTANALPCRIASSSK